MGGIRPSESRISWRDPLVGAGGVSPGSTSGAGDALFIGSPASAACSNARRNAASRSCDIEIPATYLLDSCSCQGNASCIKAEEERVYYLAKVR